MRDVWIRHVMKDDETNYTGEPYLLLYKDAYIKYYRQQILITAFEEKIPAILLAGVAWSEAGGKPDDFKAKGMVLYRQLLDKMGGTKENLNKLSNGIIAMQLRVAAETLGLDPQKLTSREQLQLKTCLESDDFNMRLAAKHLRYLILFDYPDADTLYASEEQIILAASRYNRGIERAKIDFINSIKAEPGTLPLRTYSEYGRALIGRSERVKKLLYGY
ncbi:hypothetical protein [Saezia sanguinis]|uniref:hypothetical protein n=1 Tax=Saezia sanguinis TaxID=1965230 RepID=UPI0030D8046A